MISARSEDLPAGPSKYVLVACLPKSGSTWLSKMLAAQLNYGYGTLRSSPGQVEQDFYEPELIDHYGSGYVIHQHLKAASHNLELVEKYKVRPLVLTRNIYDIIISFHDHLHRESYQYWFMIFPDQNYFQLDKEAQLDMVIDFLTPWVVNFVVTWERNKNTDKQLWLTYESLVADPEKVYREIHDFLGSGIPDHKLHESLATSSGRDDMRFNRGVVGRGQHDLSEAQMERIRTFTRYFPNIDFSSIGL
ncbi:MAG: sulfotransferase domain-containing protein [Flavobacteriales bacterium]|nr:sulfotransferase domain-containing protein [Flavobacteriales bacterium]